jgi:FixJ family two-component response regulator
LHQGTASQSRTAALIWLQMRESNSSVAVIEDDESVRESVVSLIESVGYEATFFGSAEEFLDSPNVNRVNCLIVDVRLPGISGLQLYAQLNKSAQRFRTIFVTAHMDERARAWALNAGAVAFLYKPFQAAALLTAVRTATRGT